MSELQSRAPEQSKKRKAALYGLLAGPLAAMAVYVLLPEAYVSAGGEAIPLSHAAKLTAALATWMAVWWMTEAISIYATALLPLAVLPAGSAVGMKEAASAYANELIFLFMGGFILALGMQRWGLHRRIALNALRVVGTRPRIVIAGFMGITAVLSMWVSNTATALMMMPIAASMVDLLVQDDGAPERAGTEGAEEEAEEEAELEGERQAERKAQGEGHRFAICLMLGIAYAASIGGLGTIIGSPPNVFVVSYLKSELGQEISFLRWMSIGLPLVVVLLPLTWFLLTFVLHPVRLRELGEGAAKLREAHDQLGRAKPGEWAVFLVFLVTASLWVTRPLLGTLELGGVRPFAGLTDAGIAILASLLLFVIPVSRRLDRFVMNWEWAVKLPWGLLILFGGGLSLAGALDSTGVSAFLGAQVQGLAGLPTWLLIFLVTLTVIFITELTSNTATTAAFVPILAAFASGLGLPAVALIIPAALAASCAFMLPVATPPNAIVFGTGRVTIPEMAQAGIWLNLISVIVITAVSYLLIIPLLSGN